MADQIPTRFGPLGRVAVDAVHLVISYTANHGIVALTTVHMQLSFRPDRRLALPLSQTPAERWESLMVWLFGDIPDADPRELDLTARPAVTEQEQRTIDQLLGAAGAFLMAEAATLNCQIDTWQAVYRDGATPHEHEISRMQSDLAGATAAGHALLLHVGKGTWQDVLMAKTTAMEPSADDEVCTALTARHTCGTLETSKPQTRQEADELLATVIDALTGHPPPPLLVIVVDHDNDFATAASERTMLELVLARMSVLARDSGQLAVAVLAVDGRQTDPILLDVTHPPRLPEATDTLLRQAVRAAARSYLRGSDTRPRPHDSESLLGRVEELASVLTFAVDALDPVQIVILTNLPGVSVQEGDNPLTVTPPADFRARLVAMQCWPDLSRCTLSLVAPDETWSFTPYWNMIRGHDVVHEWFTLGHDTEVDCSNANAFDHALLAWPPALCLPPAVYSVCSRRRPSAQSLHRRSQKAQIVSCQPSSSANLMIVTGKDWRLRTLLFSANAAAVLGFLAAVLQVRNSAVGDVLLLLMLPAAVGIVLGQRLLKRMVSRSNVAIFRSTASPTTRRPQSVFVMSRNMTNRVRVSNGVSADGKNNADTDAITGQR